MSAPAGAHPHYGGQRQPFWCSALGPPHTRACAFGVGPKVGSKPMGPRCRIHGGTVASRMTHTMFARGRIPRRRYTIPGQHTPGLAPAGQGPTQHGLKSPPPPRESPTGPIVHRPARVVGGPRAVFGSGGALKPMTSRARHPRKPLTSVLIQHVSRIRGLLLRGPNDNGLPCAVPGGCRQPAGAPSTTCLGTVVRLQS